jgi:hypothetical protein
MHAGCELRESKNICLKKATPCKLIIPSYEYVTTPDANRMYKCIRTETCAGIFK